MPQLPKLLTPINNSIAEQTLREVISVFELNFPGRIRSWYVEGSFADGSFVGSSDLDVLAVFKDSFKDKAEQKEAERLGNHCAGLSELELDFGFEDEARFEKDGLNPALKLNSLLIYGEDIRANFKLVSIEEWTRDRMHSSYWRTVMLFNRTTPVTLPLDYPIPADEFFGYCQRKLRLSDGRTVYCTRDLIRLVSWSATALLAYRNKKYVASKRQCLSLYREVNNDEWAGLLEDIFTKCRAKWNYLIPPDPAERLQLRDICRRTLAFENHFMENYRNFASEELASDFL